MSLKGHIILIIICPGSLRFLAMGRLVVLIIYHCSLHCLAIPLQGYVPQGAGSFISIFWLSHWRAMSLKGQIVLILISYGSLHCLAMGRLVLYIVWPLEADSFCLLYMVLCIVWPSYCKVMSLKGQIVLILICHGSLHCLAMGRLVVLIICHGSLLCLAIPLQGYVP